MRGQLGKLWATCTICDWCRFGCKAGPTMSTVGVHYSRLQMRPTQWQLCFLAAAALALMAHQPTFASVPKLPPGSHRPKQQLGQSYLTDPNTIAKIVGSFQEACNLVHTKSTKKQWWLTKVLLRCILLLHACMRHFFFMPICRIIWLSPYKLY